MQLGPLYSEATLPRLAVFGVLTPQHIVTARMLSPSPKMRSFNRFPPLQIKKHQATSNNYQNGTDPNQSNRHLSPFLLC